MHVGISVRHPEHVKFYRHAVEELRSRGHEVSVLVREFRATTDLLAAYGLSHTVLADEARTSRGHLTGHLQYETKLLRRARTDSIDVLTSVGGRAISHLAPLAGTRSVVFVDWRPTRLDDVVARLADTVCTPAYLDADLSGRQVVYDGLQELAYLHPQRFRPGLESLDVDPSEPLFVLGTATEGPEDGWLEAVATVLSAHGQVYLSADSAAVDDRLVDGRFDHANVHAALTQADLCVGDLATLVTESAVLGTPAVYVGESPPSRVEYLERRYGLVRSAAGKAGVLDAVETMVTDDALARRTRTRREQLLADHGDTTETVVQTLLRESGR
jgi:predicted glycosyltransferase